MALVHDGGVELALSGAVCLWMPVAEGENLQGDFSPLPGCVCECPSRALGSKSCEQGVYLGLIQQGCSWSHRCMQLCVFELPPFPWVLLPKQAV